jgi:hypothetical protein
MLITLTSLGFSISISLNRDFVELWVGPHAFGDQNVSSLMGIALWFASIAYLAYDVLLATGAFLLISRTFITASVVHVALLFVLLRFGMWGAPASFLLATVGWGSFMWLRIGRSIGLFRTDVLTVLTDTVAIVVLAAAPATPSPMLSDGCASGRRKRSRAPGEETAERRGRAASLHRAARTCRCRER